MAGLLYLATSFFCIYISFTENIAQIWFSNALLLIIIFRSDYTLRWWYYGAGLFANILGNALTGTAIPISLGLAFSNAIEMLPALLLLEFTRTTPRIPYIILSLIGGCILSGFTASSMFNYDSGNSYLRTALNWTSTDILSILMLMPAGLTFHKERFLALIRSKQVIKLISLISFSIFMMFVSFSFGRSPFLFIALTLIFAAFQLDLFSTTLVCLLTGISFLFYVGQETIPSLNYPVEVLKQFGYLFMSLSMVPAIIISNLIEQRSNYERKIKESEQIFRGAIENSVLGMSLHKTNGQWMAVNKALCDMLGYSEAELLRMNFREVTHPDDLNNSQMVVDQLVSGVKNTCQIEKRYIRKSGDIIWAMLSISAVRDEQGKILYFITQIENIDKRKRIEKALQDSEQRWKFALDGGIQGVWDWNVPENRVYYSRTWIKMLGYDEEEISDNPNEWFSRIHPDDAADVMKKIKAHLDGLTNLYTAEYRLKCKDGHYKWVLDRGKIISTTAENKPLRLIGTHTDIDLLKSAESEREKLTERFKLAIESGKIGVFELHLATDKFDADERMVELYDFGSDESHQLRSDWAKRVHPKDLERARKAFLVTTETGVPFDTEFRIITRMGNTRYIRAKASAIRNKQGEIESIIGINWDITEEKILSNQLFEEKERLDITLRSIGDAVIVTDENGLITFTSTVAQQLIGKSGHQLHGNELSAICILKEDDETKKFINPVKLCLEQKKTIKSNDCLHLETTQGKKYFVQYTANPLRSASDEMIGCVLVLQDVTTTQRLQHELAHQATHDALTGLINRREFERKLSHYLNDERAHTSNHVVAMLDLDNFKIVNDTAGHHAGDELLKNIADMLKKRARASDIVARIGGDEFALILPNCEISNATTITETIVNAVKQYRFHWDDKTYEIGVSIGLSEFQPKQLPMEKLLAQADMACYQAKHLGGGNISIYTEDDAVNEKLHSEIKIVPRINAALENDEFLLFARQVLPTTPTEQDQTLFEVLIRMVDDNNNLIMPSQFIKVAERHHLMADIDEWVLNQLLIVQADKLINHPHISLSINLSYQSIHTPAFIDKFARILALTKIEHHRLGFELTEKALQHHHETIPQFLSLVERSGCFIALDDFGAGLSSFDRLKNFSSKFVKIDGHLIKQLNKSETNQIIIESINALAHRLNVKTIAEFVETPELRDIVRSMGLDYMQGDAVAKVISLDEMFARSPAKNIIT